MIFEGHMKIDDILDLTPEQVVWIEQYHRHVSWMVRFADMLCGLFYSANRGKKSRPWVSLVPDKLPDEEDNEEQKERSQEETSRKLEEAFARFGQRGQRTGNIQG